jgi:hypothetical protein
MAEKDQAAEILHTGQESLVNDATATEDYSKEVRIDIMIHMFHSKGIIIRGKGKLLISV